MYLSTRRRVRAPLIGALVAAAALTVGCGPTEVLVGDTPGVARVMVGIPGVVFVFSFPDTASVSDARSVSIGIPAGVAAASDGSFYFADRLRRRIGFVSADGTLSWPVGAGICGFPGRDATVATDLCLADPGGLALTPGGDLIVADPGVHLVYRWAVAAGRVERLLGTGDEGRAPHGSTAAGAPTAAPTDVVLGPDDAVYVTEAGNHRVVRITGAGVLEVVAGAGVAGDSGDGGAAGSALLFRPEGLTWMGDTLYIADTGNNRIRRVVGGTIEAYAGIGASGFAGDGDAARVALFRRPGRMAATGSLLLVTDRGNHRVRVIRVGPDSIATFGGTGTATVGEDLVDIGRTPLIGPAGLAVAGRAVFVADSGGYVIRRVVR